MSLFNRFTRELKKAVSGSKPDSGKTMFGSIDYTIPQIPCIVEKKNDPWVHYGEDNLYPLRISDLRSGSGIHNSIIKTKTKMTAGEGFLINDAVNEAESKQKYESLPADIKNQFDDFVKNKLDQDDIYTVANKLADDMQTHGAYSYELIFNMDFSKIVRVKYVNVENVRSGKLENDQVKTYWYSRDWRNYKKEGYKPIEMFAFDGTDKEHLNQIVYEKVGKGEYYGEVPYKGCLNWIMTDFKMGLYHLSNIDNGMNPGMHWKFYKLPADENEKQKILRDLDRTYKGAPEAGKRIVTFSDGKELATDVEPIAVTGLDKQLLLLAELCDKKIITGHQLTSPLLAGVSISGQIGGNTELKVAGTMFDNLSMEADRNHLAKSFQKILDYNKTPIKLAINPFDQFKEKVVSKTSGGITEAINSLSPLVANKVLESMTTDEIRELVGLKPSLVIPTQPPA